MELTFKAIWIINTIHKNLKKNFRSGNKNKERGHSPESGSVHNDLKF